ncbi:hypothetical protein [Clostridium felsineum]|uniref:Uncharacterized protein n=1 Tax=Clostridium felsineum TaxID=36839 RepID=A0A1S8MFZ8_9CLOT|nr:hypothetical protein [Clostridium felsineum]MCR3758812.1 hypothetical protein [Clostridium felsineum]URZ05367.1 hypothetical protein CLROS_006910 [Clostridium felsineum]URZ10408.1 hypothetical protein CROST_011160 [Clostridium felsineum]
MAGVSKVDNASNGSSPISKKISFNVGDSFSARIISGKSGEVTLRTLDGWNFNAKVENPEDINDGQTAKFVVTGVEDGKIKLKFVQNENSSESTISNKNIFEDLVKELGLNKADVNEKVLKLMIKYNMPLTKDNIVNMENLIDFNNRLSGKTEKSDEFIMKYLQNRNIEPNSEEGKNIISTLKNLSTTLQGMTTEDMFTLMENHIDITSKNIESYIKLFKGEGSIYNELKNIEQSLNENVKPQISNEKNIDGMKDINIKEAIQQHNDGTVGNLNKETQDSNINKLQGNLKLLDSMKETLNQNGLKEVTVAGKKVNIDNIIKNYVSENWQDITNESETELVSKMIDKISKETGMDKTQLSDIFKNITDGDKTKTNNLAKSLNSSLVENSKTMTVINEENVSNQISDKEEKVLTNLVDNKLLKGENVKTTADNVKQEINLKINNMQETISRLLSDSSGNMNLQEKVSELIKNNINDFKVFNSISNEYYYMDIPVRNNNDDYQCKLIIKDDRKSGKVVDSKNVKIVTSIKTVNMGKVDAYITVLNNSMGINMKCDEPWVKVLDKTKTNLVKKIENMGYNININVQKKKEEKIDIVECRDFFNDKGYFKLDTRV